MAIAANPGAVSRKLTAAGFTRSDSHSTRIRGWHVWNAGFTVKMVHDMTQHLDAPKVCRVEYTIGSRVMNAENHARALAKADAKLHEIGDTLTAQGFHVAYGGRNRDEYLDVYKVSDLEAAMRAEVAAAEARNRAEVQARNEGQAQQVARQQRTAPAPVTRKCRATGARVTVTTAEQAGLDLDGGKWLTICEDHGNICYHATKALRDDHARDSSGWCEDCQAAMSTEARGAWADDYIPEG